MDEAWERAIEVAAGGQAEPRSLTLDGAVKCLNGRLPPRAVLERFRSLEHLSIANVRLASLEDFPRLPNLRRLTLSDNRIAGGLEYLVTAGLNSLRDLDLSNNRIQSLENLTPLAQLRLVSLDLYECPVTRTKDYRSRVFGMIRSLKYLDKMDADENERPETDDDDEEEEEDDEEDDEEGGEEEDDLGSGEIDGDDRARRTASGVGRSRGVGGIVDADEDEESDADEEMEAGGLGRRSQQPHSNGLREGDDGDEEEEEDVEGEDDEDLGEEINREEEDVGDEEDGDEDVVEVGGKPGSRGRMTSTEGEIDGHEQGEDDEDDGDGEEEEEDLGSEFLVQPIAQSRHETGGSAVDVFNEEDGSEDVEDVEDHRSNGAKQHPSSSSQPNKRKKGASDDSVEESRQSKHR